MDKKEIGKKIKYYRQLAGLTQEKLAEKVNIHEKQISRIESGIHFPTFENLVKIFEILNIDFKNLSENADCKSSKDKKKLLDKINKLNEKEIKCFLNIIDNIISTYKK